MREINECTAEVFRRSEKRIKERKKNRNRVLALCIPLCLIVTVFSVMTLPAMRTKNGAAEEIAVDGTGSLVCPYNAVEIHDEGMSPEYYEKITDKTAVTKIYITVDSLFADMDAADRDCIEDFFANRVNLGSEPPTEAESNACETGCTIIFTAEDGSRTVYTLSENTLMNVNTNDKVVLSDEEVVRLMIAFGVSERGEGST